MTDSLRFTIEGDPVPSQMGALLPNGRIARSKGTENARDYKRHVSLMTMWAVNKARWVSNRSESFRVTARFFVGNARTIDADNLAKCLLDGLKSVAFPDDRQVYELHLFKRIDRDRPRTEVEIERLAKEPTE